MGRRLEFTKMHGIGNDYIYVDCFEKDLERVPELARLLSRRHFSIGADGLVLILPSEIADARMRMFNADGSEAEMCGNAVRCVAKFLYEKGICKQERIKLETASGVKVLELGCKGAVVERVRVDMGEPILSSSLIPVVHEKEQVIGEPFVVEDRELALTCVSMGNPHAVFFVPEINDDLVMGLGPKIECHGIFPKRINVEFVQVLSPEAVRMRVWERGSGETLACGTGACAVCVAAVLRGLCARSLRVELLGGELEIEWSEENNRVYMTGPAAVAFEGSVDLSGWV